MSKKLIAVAAAAALALSALIAAPAYAAFGVTLTNMNTGAAGVTAAAPALISVPTEDVLRSVDTFTTNTAVRIGIAATASGVSHTVTATGGVLLLTSAQLAASTTTHKTGQQSLTVISDGSSAAAVFAYTTSTATGTVTVTDGSNSALRHIKGVTATANAYTMKFTGPSSASPAAVMEFEGTVVDMYGNNVTGATLSVVGLGGNLAPGTPISVTPDQDAAGKYSFEITNRNTAGIASFNVSLVLSATEKKASFGSKVASQFYVVNATDLTAQVKLLEGQVAALQATVAASRTKALSVTKKKYNTLARKWNAANPSARVALKK